MFLCSVHGVTVVARLAAGPGNVKRRFRVVQGFCPAWATGREPMSLTYRDRATGPVLVVGETATFVEMWCTTNQLWSADLRGLEL